MFCHFIIHSQFEHSLSHSRANGSPSEEPDLALSDDLTVHWNGQVWSRHDSGSRAWSGGIKSRSYRHRWWIGRAQAPFPWALLILFDRDPRRDRLYTTHGKLIIPYSVRAVIASLILFSFELSWFYWDRDAHTTTQSCWHPSNLRRS